MTRNVRRGAVLGWIIAFGALAAFASNLEVRREAGVPGDVAAILPPASGSRALSIRLGAPPGTSVSSLVEWIPSDRELTVRLVSTATPDRPLAILKGRSPVAIGARTETQGATSLIVTDPDGGGESMVIGVMVNWSATPAAERDLPARREPSAAAGAPAGAALDSPVRLVEISWREDGEITPAALRRDGLVLRFSGAINPEMAGKALRLEIGFPGRAPGLTAFEEIMPEVRALGDRLLVFPPRDLPLADGAPIRLTLDGDRLLGRNGIFVDPDGSGLTLPSGDGRPGGIFRSAFRIAPLR